MRKRPHNYSARGSKGDRSSKHRAEYGEMRVLRMHLEKAFRVPMDSDASRAVNLDLVQRVSAHQRGGFGSESRRMALAQVYYTWLSGVHAATPPPLAFSPKLNQAPVQRRDQKIPSPLADKVFFHLGKIVKVIIQVLSST